ncbi:MAG: Gfo/Idh/MocA family oxidoreductase [Eubacteriales bacterium]|nr:Gfo/Idh/MocA family oxidoreductase [Eubacteriales bacterium]
MRYALIGCGRISPNHVAAAQANHLDIVGLCDTDAAMTQARAEQFGLTAVPRYTDCRQLLAKQRPELAAIATSSGNHAAVALECIRAGCSVMIEKPIALSLDDADQIIREAKEHGVTVGVCHQNRFNKSIRHVREALESGRFGRLYHGTAHIRWQRNEDYYRQAPWRGTWAQDGGALMNQCIHNIDLLRWMLGDEVTEVMAYTDRLAHDYIQAEDLGLALVRFANGAYGMIEGTTNVYPRNLEETLYLFGETGTVKVGGKSVNSIEKWFFADEAPDEHELVKAQSIETPPNVYGFGHTPLYADVIAAIREGRQPYVDGEAGRRALELVLGIYLSAARGEPVKFPLSHVACTDFEGRF